MYTYFYVSVLDIARDHRKYAVFSSPSEIELTLNANDPSVEIF